MHLSPAATEAAIRLLDGAQSGVATRGKTWRYSGHALASVSVGWSGLRGSNPSNWLGKPGHYHYAKPARPDLINLRREAQARSSEKRSQALRRKAPATKAGAGVRRRTGCPGRSAPRRSSTVGRASVPAR